jgi:hypothetical protein
VPHLAAVGVLHAVSPLGRAGCALAIVWFARRMDMVDHEGHPIHLGPKALFYWPWLLKEIVKSAWDVSKIILHPKLPISPTLFDRALAASTVGTVSMLLMAATVHSRLDNAFASRILPYAVNEPHAAEVGGVLVTPSD